MIDYATSLLEQANDMLQERERLHALHQAVGHPDDLSIRQWLQIYALARNFAPDLIVELGRGYGNSTCVFGEAIARGQKGRLVSIGNDTLRCWETVTLPRLRGLVTPEWLGKIDIVQEDIMRVDLPKVFEGSERILLFWDAHGLELAYSILSKSLPALQSKEHVVLVHDMTDSRYSDTDTMYSKEPNVRLWLGPINSSEEEFVPLYDFLSRNGINFDSPGDSIRRYLEQERSKGNDATAGLKLRWEELVGSSADPQESHWIYFSLGERTSRHPLAFPPEGVSRGKVTQMPSSNVTSSIDIRQHPAFQKFPIWRGTIPAGFQSNFLGARINEAYFLETRSPERFWEGVYPPFGEEYFEWIDLLESALSAQKEFVFFELGAGFGRWSVNAVLAAKALNKNYRVLAVEAEPKHFSWLKENFALNGLDPGRCRTIEAAVAEKDGRMEFFVGDSVRWYGQSLTKGPNDDLRDDLGKPIAKKQVDAVSLKTLMKSYDQIDLLDMDVQGAEYSILKPAAKELSSKVKRIHVETHSREIEVELRSLMNGMRWLCKFDYPCASEVDTQYGRIKFQGGLQTWTNPDL